MIRQETHQIHSRNETAKSLAIARGLPSSMKRLVPTVTAPTVNKVSGSINAFDGFSGDNDGEF